VTVIVYRDGELVADAPSYDSGFSPYSGVKIARHDSGWLFGAAGATWVCRRFLREMLENTNPELLSCSERGFSGLEDFGDGATGIGVDPEGNIHIFGGPERWSVPDRYAAIGSGGEVALGCLEMGASARVAVKIACRRIGACNYPLLALGHDGSRYIHMEGSTWTPALGAAHPHPKINLGYAANVVEGDWPQDRAVKTRKRLFDDLPSDTEPSQADSLASRAAQLKEKATNLGNWAASEKQKANKVWDDTLDLTTEEILDSERTTLKPGRDGSRFTKRW
jgi:hypothetical protein